MIEYVCTNTRNNDSTLFIVFKRGQHTLLLVFNCWREILEVNVKMKIKAGIILLHVIPENANPYDNINERNSERIYLDGYSWTKKAVFFSGCSWTAEHWRWRDCGLSKRRELLAQRHRLTFQKSSSLASSLWEHQISHLNGIWWSTNYEVLRFVISDEYCIYFTSQEY